MPADTNDANFLYGSMRKPGKFAGEHQQVVMILPAKILIAAAEVRKEVGNAQRFRDGHSAVFSTTLA